MLPSFLYPSNCPIGAHYTGENLPAIARWFLDRGHKKIYNLFFEVYSLIHFWKVTLC